MKVFESNLIFAIPSLLASTSAAADTRLGQMYAYGTNITGFPVFIGDGTAYIGTGSLSTISGAANVTFEQSGTSIVVHKIDGNADSTISNDTKYFAIDTNSGASKPVLIAKSTNETGYTTDSFSIYGTQIIWVTSTSEVEANFYVLKTDVDNIWELYWDADTAAATKGTPVVLKAIPPAFSGN